MYYDKLKDVVKDKIARGEQPDDCQGHRTTVQPYDKYDTWRMMYNGYNVRRLTGMTYNVRRVQRTTGMTYVWGSGCRRYITGCRTVVERGVVSDSYGINCINPK